VYVRAKVMLRGFKGCKELTTLVDTGASMTVIDSSLADEVGVEFTGKERALVTASGHKLVGRVAIVKELIIEGEALDYERVLVLSFSDELKKLLRDLGVDQTIILGVATLESAGFVPDPTTGRLRRVGLALILLA
jgi:predicted aspartyl protease